MSLPDFHDPSRTGVLRAPDVAAAITAGRAAKMAPAEHDEVRRVLLLVDAQMDFISPAGAMASPGAVDDARRCTRFLLENASRLTTVAASLDSHVPLQIFFSGWWVDEDGRHPEPFTIIRHADVVARRWRPTRDRLWSVRSSKRSKPGVAGT